MLSAWSLLLGTDESHQWLTITQRMPLHTNQIPSQILNGQVLRNVRVCVFFRTSSGVSAGLFWATEPRSVIFDSSSFHFERTSGHVPTLTVSSPLPGSGPLQWHVQEALTYLPEWNLVSQEFKCFMQQPIVENVANHISVLSEFFSSSQPFKKCFKVLCKSLDLYFLFLGIFVF